MLNANLFSFLMATLLISLHWLSGHILIIKSNQIKSKHWHSSDTNDTHMSCTFVHERADIV